MKRLLRTGCVVVLVACGSSTTTTGGGGGGAGGGTGAGGGSAKNTNPVAAFTASAISVAQGAAIAFDGTASTDADGDPLTYSWAFDNGSRGGGAKLAHVFTTEGTFAVTLTVHDGRGGTATDSKMIAVTVGPSPANPTPTTVRLRPALAGVAVNAAVTDAQGKATVDLPSGVTQRVKLTKTGYVPQLRVISIPANTAAASIQTRLIGREPAQSLADAAVGGSITGKLGAKVSLPAKAFAVTGAVDVFLTPLDPVGSPDTLPGLPEGYDPAGMRQLLLTAGAVELTFEKGGQRLDLAPGQTATIELPLAAATNPANVAWAVGATIPLWSLDEKAGTWVQEGEATVIAGNRARATVGHFSFWSVAVPAFPTDRKPRCVDATAQPVACWFRASTHCLPELTTCPIPPTAPGWTLDAVLPPNGLQQRFPRDTATYLVAYSPDFTQRAVATTQNASADPLDILLTLAPVPVTPGTPLTIPSSTPGNLTATSQLDLYTFDANAGDLVYLQVQRTGNVCKGTLSVTNAEGRLWGPSIFGRPPPQGSAAKDAFVGLKIPATATYVVQVLADASPAAVPCPYTLLASASANYPIVLGESPAYGAADVPLNTPLGFTFSQPLKATSIVGNTLGLSAGYTGSGPQNQATNVLIPPATVSHDAGLYGGLQYSLVQSTPVAAIDGGSSQILYSVPFRTVETPGKASPIINGAGQLRVATNAAGQAFIGSEYRVIDYLPGKGWLLPATVGSSISVDGLRLASVITDRAAACYPSINRVFANRRTAAGWGTPVQISTPGLTASRCELAVDAQDRATVSFGSPTDGGHAFYVVRSAADGGTFGAPEQIRLADDFIDAWDHQSNASGAQVISWRKSSDSKALAMVSLPPPATFTAETTLGTDPSYGVKGAIDSAGNAMVVFASATGMHARRFDRAAGTWGPATLLDTSVFQSFSQCGYEFFVAAIPPNDFIVAGCSFGGASRPFWAARYRDATAAFDARVDLADNASIFRWNFFAGPDGSTVFSWVEKPGDPGFYKRFSPATGWDATATDVGTLNTGIPKVPTGQYLFTGGNTLLGLFLNGNDATWVVKLP